MADSAHSAPQNNGAVLLFCEVLALGFGLPPLDDIYHGRPVTARMVAFVGIAFFCSAFGFAWPKLQGHLNQRFQETAAAVASDFRWWVLMLLAFFVSMTVPIWGPTQSREDTAIDANIHAPSTAAKASPAPTIAEGLDDSEPRPAIAKPGQLTPQKIWAEIHALPPAQREGAGKKYQDLTVEWTMKLYDVKPNREVYPDQYWLTFDVDDDPVYVNEVPLNEYPELGIIAQGTYITVKGRIGWADGQRVDLKDVTLSWPGRLGPRSSTTSTAQQGGPHGE